MKTEEEAVKGMSVASSPAVLERSPALSRLVIDARWRCLIEEVCVLKEAIDHASRWPDESRHRPWIGETLKRVGLEAGDFQNRTFGSALEMPHSFLALVLGGWFSYRAEASVTFRGLAEIPEWAVVGWLRIDQHRHTSALHKDQIASRATKVQSEYNDREKVFTYGFEGIPLLWAGEGKNRTQLFRMAGLPRRSELILYPRPDASEFVASRLLGMPGITVLSKDGRSEVLPFGDLSRRLLIAMGVRWSDVPNLKGWGSLRCSGRRLSLASVARLVGHEKRARLALMGDTKMSGLERAGR